MDVPFSAFSLPEQINTCWEALIPDAKKVTSYHCLPILDSGTMANGVSFPDLSRYVRSYVRHRGYVTGMSSAPSGHEIRPLSY